MDKQYEIPHCTVPCFPIDCPDCPFGPMDMTLAEIQRKWLCGVEE